MASLQIQNESTRRPLPMSRICFNCMKTTDDGAFFAEKSLRPLPRITLLQELFFTANIPWDMHSVKEGSVLLMSDSTIHFK